MIRVRFAPSPTGLMHLGGVRTALLNYLFALHSGGLFILRIEDTDLERNFDPGGKEIMHDLHWLGLTYHEGPDIGGPHKPYLQSQRERFYQEKLNYLKQKNLVYRCFCTVEELEKKRNRQIALKIPPRYDQTCTALTQAIINERLENAVPFIWRFKVNTNQEVTFTDMARGLCTFHLSNFSDFPLTREDGSFTFLFVNCVDDILMQISHVLRGEDHLSNTANQVALYKALDVEIPIFWHLPIICNVEGKKLSKRDFGFSLKDLQLAGFLPESICNYLGIIGNSFAHEIMSLAELAQNYNFDHLHTTGSIRYDLEKLRWVNHQWIMRYSSEKLAFYLRPFLQEIYPQAAQLDEATFIALINVIKSELVTLKDVTHVLKFYFEEPIIDREKLLELLDEKTVSKCLHIINEYTPQLDLGTDHFLDQITQTCKKEKIPLKSLYTTLRLLLTGAAQGISTKEIILLLGKEKTKKRFEIACTKFETK